MPATMPGQVTGSLGMLPTRVLEVPGGIRLMQGRVVLSELRREPGPTHSVFDVLAALIHRWVPPGRMGILGFGAGGILAPLRALGCDRRMEGVDLDATGHELFQRWCPGWVRDVSWKQADAACWLEGQRGRFAGLLEDLSEPRDGDVYKPRACDVRMPRLVRRRLGTGGVAVFNLVPDPGGEYPGLGEVRRLFACVLEVRYSGFLNRTVLVADQLAGAGTVGRGLQVDLRRMGSRLAGQTRVATVQDLSPGAAWRGLG